MVVVIERLSTDTAKLSQLACGVHLNDPQKALLGEILNQLKSVLETQDTEMLTASSACVTQVPVFDPNDLVRTLQTAAFDENALRKVMLSTDIPLHWNTIYQRIYPLIVDRLRPQDEQQQAGHPGLSRWQYRLSWHMQQLRSEGVVRSVGNGYWMRTDPDAPPLQAALFDM